MIYSDIWYKQWSVHAFEFWHSNSCSPFILHIAPCLSCLSSQVCPAQAVHSQFNITSGGKKKSWGLTGKKKSKKIEAKLFLWRCEDKSWGLLLSLCCQVCSLGFGLMLLVPLCGWGLDFLFSPPVENGLLWGVWHNFDLSWCNFCQDQRNPSISRQRKTVRR